MAEERRRVKKVVAVTGRRSTDLPQEMTYETMIGHLKEHMGEVVSLAVEKNVNGKINKLTDSFNNYVTEDTKWKERAEPWIRAAENSEWAFKIFVLILKTAGLFGAAIAAYISVKNLIK